VSNAKAELFWKAENRAKTGVLGMSKDRGSLVPFPLSRVPRSSFA
jgi:hypothetical protein